MLELIHLWQQLKQTIFPQASCTGRAKIAAQIGQDRSVLTAEALYSGLSSLGKKDGGAVVLRCCRRA